MPDDLLTYEEWRLNQAITYSLWLATDEAAQALAILRWHSPRNTFFPSPYIYHNDRLIPAGAPIHEPRVAFLILTDAHWVGVEASNEDGTWTLTYLGANEEQIERLTPHVLHQLALSAQQHVVTTGPWLTIPHACG